MSGSDGTGEGAGNARSQSDAAWIDNDHHRILCVARLDGRTLVGVGTINHESRNQSGCWNPLQRSIAIGDELATIGLDQIKFSNRTDLTARDSVSWGDPDQYGCYWYMEG